MKLFLNILIFFIAGELLFRFDKATNIFDNTVKIQKSIGTSSELTLLNNNGIPIDSSSIRILILGDSYIYGGGIDSSKKFSNKLRALFQKSPLYANKKIYVLDVSRPSNNTLDNYNTYYLFNEKFKPQVIILGYNINDVEGDLDPKKETKGNEQNTSSKPLHLPKKAKAKLNTVDKIYKFVFNSVLLSNSLKNINSYLKSYGIIAPNTQFDIELKYYTDNKPQWTKSKQLLDDMSADIARQNTSLIVFKLPEMNLLEHPNIFRKTDSIITGYFSDKKNIYFINGEQVFENKKSSDYILSRYDGHPNAKAHELMAGYMFSYINENNKIKW